MRKNEEHIKLYAIDELLDVSFKGYTRVMQYLRNNIGQSSSDEALIKYASQAGFKASSDGTLYKPIN